MALRAGREGVAASQVDYQGRIKGLNIPIARPSQAGLVKPVAKTSGMTQDVGVDLSGKLYTAPSEVRPVAKTSSMTQDVGVDSTGKLFTASSTITELMSANEITVGAEHNLSDAYTNYDVIILVGSSTATNQRYIQAAAFPVDFLELNDGIGCANESVNLYLMLVSTTKVKVMGTSFGTPRTMAIYGIKF